MIPAVEAAPSAERIAPDLEALAVPVSSLREDPRNARLHDEVNVRAVRESLRRFGQRKPIVVAADGMVVAGNATLRAARKLGWARIAATRAADLDEAALREYAVADNRTAELGTWDGAALADVLESIRGQDEELARTLLAFTPLELSRLGLSVPETPAPVDEAALEPGTTCPSCGFRW